MTTPHMRAYVIMGIKVLAHAVLGSSMIFTLQDIRMCSTIEEAREWLVQQ